MFLRKHLDVVFVFIVALTASQAHGIWLQRLGYEYQYKVAYSIEGKPGAYRALIPFLSRTVETLTGLDVVFCMSALVVLSAIFLYYSLRYLYKLFMGSDFADLFAFAVCEAAFLLVLGEMHVYDLATIMFFALGLALLAQKNFRTYYLIFLLATLNRETSFLLTLIFMVYGIQEMSPRAWLLGVLYQVLSWFGVRSVLEFTLVSVPGDPFWWTFPKVPVTHLENYGKTLVLLSILIFILFLVLRKWGQKPQFLRLAFLVLFPIQVVLYILVGSPFEIRVFAESLPVVACLAVYTRKIESENPASSFT